MFMQWKSKVICLNDWSLYCIFNCKISVFIHWISSCYYSLRKPWRNKGIYKKSWVNRCAIRFHGIVIRSHGLIKHSLAIVTRSHVLVIRSHWQLVSSLGLVIHSHGNSFPRAWLKLDNSFPQIIQSVLSDWDMFSQVEICSLRLQSVPLTKTTHSLGLQSVPSNCCWLLKLRERIAII